MNSSITYSVALKPTIENITLTGTAAINATGNAAANVLKGNTAANTLDGGLGGDLMTGGSGNDTYIVNSSSDRVSELAGTGTGTDLVKSSTTFTLSTNVENILLTGTTAISGTGNASDNTLTGNSAANTLVGVAGDDTLTGLAGNDVLDGGAGNDVLTGGVGVDVFKFALSGAANFDRIIDFSLVDDIIKLENTGTGAFNALVAGALNANNFVSGAGVVGGDIIAYNTTTGALFYDANSDGAGEQIALLGNKPAGLSAADFTVI